MVARRCETSLRVLRGVGVDDRLQKSRAPYSIGGENTRWGSAKTRRGYHTPMKFLSKVTTTQQLFGCGLWSMSYFCALFPYRCALAVATSHTWRWLPNESPQPVAWLNILYFIAICARAFDVCSHLFNWIIQDECGNSSDVCINAWILRESGGCTLFVGMVAGLLRRIMHCIAICSTLLSLFLAEDFYTYFNLSLDATQYNRDLVWRRIGAMGGQESARLGEAKLIATTRGMVGYPVFHCHLYASIWRMHTLVQLNHPGSTWQLIWCMHQCVDFKTVGGMNAFCWYNSWTFEKNHALYRKLQYCTLIISGWRFFYVF